MNMGWQLLWMAIAGGLGTLCRYGLWQFVHRTIGASESLHQRALEFPIGTLAVNVMGCVLIGWGAERVVSLQWRAILLVGFLGGFTTFSSFSIETIRLAQTGKALLAAANVLASVFTCLAGTWLGLQFAKWMTRT